ncbi:hypothetical protein H6F76_20800 [Leptolyngbya sp. FACHB-321]|nr:hypothetical protein [Leptolyngbya sp. FACHB-321]
MHQKDGCNAPLPSCTARSKFCRQSGSEKSNVWGKQLDVMVENCASMPENGKGSDAKWSIDH